MSSTHPRSSDNQGPSTHPRDRLPPGQQLIGAERWPVIGEKYSGQPMDDWQITIGGCEMEPRTFTLPDLNRLPQTEWKLDIHCVTRWSKFDMEFGGVLLADLFELMEIPGSARYLSFVAQSDRGHSTSLKLEDAFQLGTLLALRHAGRPLPPEHGGPLRTVVPGRYFYKSLKWLHRIEFLTSDRLGYWEAETGYHNQADPWLEQRYVAPNISKQTAARLMASLDFSNRDLRGIDAAHRKLDGLNATAATLRDAKFQQASLVGANFSHAQLSNAHFEQADLTGADFSGADLEGANFCGANLVQANLLATSLFGTSFVQRLENGQRLAAKFDHRTLWPENWSLVLTTEQAEFVRSKLN